MQFSDADTLDVARQIHRADHPESDLLPYLSPQYCDVCRRMFFEELNYNLFRWVSRFPKFYFQALAGLDSQSMIFEVGSQQIQKDLRSPLRQCFAWGDRLGHAMPYLFLIGVLATTCAGRQRLSALLLALFSVYYAGIMFLVLPDQKHLGVLLVPLYVFAGAGIWADCPALLAAHLAQRQPGGMGPAESGEWAEWCWLRRRHGGWSASGLTPIASVGDRSC